MDKKVSFSEPTVSGKQKTKLQKIKGDLGKKNELISEIDMLIKKQEILNQTLEKLNQISSSFKNTVTRTQKEIVKAQKEKNLAQIDPASVREQLNSFKMFQNELREMIKADRKLTKKKIDELNTLRNNIEEFVRKMVADYNSLSKFNGNRASQPQSEGILKEPSNPKENGMRISHSLFDLYEPIKTTPIQILLKDSKRKSTGDSNKGKAKKQRTSSAS
jgi:chromosome segregation ATPase